MEGEGYAYDLLVGMGDLGVRFVCMSYLVPWTVTGRRRRWLGFVWVCGNVDVCLMNLSSTQSWGSEDSMYHVVGDICC